MDELRSVLSLDVEESIRAGFDSCRLCWALSSEGQEFLCNRRLAVWGDYTVMPAVGALVPGYHLLVASAHRGSAVTLDRDSLLQLERYLTAHLEVLRKLSDKWVVFEHGTTECGPGLGACVDHLHLHLVPMDIGLSALLADRFSDSGRVLDRLSELPSVVPSSRSAYLLVVEPTEQIWLFTPEAFSSQLIRQLIAVAIGEPGEWNWKRYPREDVAAATVKMLEGVFEM